MSMRIFLLGCALGATLSAAGQAGNRDLSFLVGTGASHAVRNLHVDASDRIYVTGEFTSFNGMPALRTVRLLPTGSTDPTWQGSQALGVDGPIRGSALQPNKRLLIGGLFDNIQGAARKNLARLDSNGALDPSFQVGAGANNEITGISESNGRIGITGYLSQYNGTPVPTYAVLTSSGALDPAFTYPSGTPLSRCILIRPNHQVYLGGSFSSFGGAAAGRLVRLHSNGTLDTSFHTAVGFNGPVEVLLEQPDGKLLVGGSFTTYNGQPAVRIARLLANGNLDPTFGPGTGASSTVRALALDAQGRIVVGGQFTTFNGVSQPFVVRLQPNGTPDPAFAIGTGLNGNPHAAAHQSNGKIVLGGVFTQYQGVNAGRILRLLTNPCVPASTPVLQATFNGSCPGDTALLAATGSLNQSAQWTWYTGSCGGAVVGQGAQIKMVLTGPTTLWVRGTGACAGTCASLAVAPPADTVAPVPNLANLPTVTGLCTVSLAAPPYATDACAGILVGTTNGPGTITAPGTHNVVWTFTDPSGNASQQIQQYVVFGLANAVLVDSTTVPEVTLSSSHNSPQASYQWLRCDSAYAPIPDAVTRFWMPAKTGVYAVRVEESGCVDTSDCLAFVQQGIGFPEYRAAPIYLVSVNGKLVVRTEMGVIPAGTLALFDAWGRRVFTGEVSSDRPELDFQPPFGMYLFQWSSPSGSVYAPQRMVHVRH